MKKSFLYKKNPFIFKAICVLLLLAFFFNSGYAQNNYYLRNHNPWGTLNNAQAMDAVFGAGNWIASNYTISAATVFTNSTRFVYMEGGENNDTYMKAFLDGNSTLIETWVSNGGRLFLNSAGWNTGMNYGFGGTSLIYPGLSSYVVAADPAHQIFNGPFTPVATSLTGSYYSHDYITGIGLTNIILGTAGGNAPVLASKNWGAGLVLFGGITSPWFHQPQPNAQNLFQNILAFLNAHEGCPANLGLTTDVRHATCLGGANGSIDLSVAGGVAPYTYSWSNGATSEDLSNLSAGNYSVEVTDNNGCKDNFNVEILDNLNVAPIINSVSASADPVSINTSINLTIDYTDNNVYSTSISWGDGTAVQTILNPSNNFVIPHTYTTAGVYTVKVKVTDACNIESDEYLYQYVVVYDPSAGFVTGGGWINSPAGAYTADPLLTGKANFGFVSKYEKGKSVPSGNTQFQFHAADMNFKSTYYEWLVISGSKAQFKGVGSINDAGNYGFLLSAVDGNLNSPQTPDRFRIKIWDRVTSAIIYDNQIGEADDALASTDISGGSIVVHAGKASRSSANSNLITGNIQEQNIANKFLITALPNPSFNYFTLISQSDNQQPISVKVTDVLGRLVETKQNINANSTITIGQQYRPGVYMMEVIQGKERQILRLVKVSD